MKIEHLLDLADAYSAHTGLRLTTVGAYAANDGKFFGRLKAGAGCTLRKASAIVRWFSDNWPADLEWPRDIARPSAAAKLPRGRRAA